MKTFTFISIALAACLISVQASPINQAKRQDGRNPLQDLIVNVFALPASIVGAGGHAGARTGTNGAGKRDATGPADGLRKRDDNRLDAKTVNDTGDTKFNGAPGDLYYSESFENLSA